MLTFVPSQLFGAKPIFLVEFHFAGRTHRYATEKVILSSNDGDIDYLPNIIDFDFVESADIVSPDLEANIVSMALIMEDVDLLLQLANGIVLEGLDAEFSYILTKYESPEQSFEERVILYKGKIQEPQFGDPDQIDGFVSLSIEAQPYDGNRLLLDQNKFIDDRFSTRDIDTADGKIWPVVFGSPGNQIQQTAGTSKNIYAAPAYCIKKKSGADPAEFMVAGHIVEASTCVIQDDEFNTVSKTILDGIDNRGNQYSYIEVNMGDGVSIPGHSNTSREWWIRMDGGISNPFQDGTITGAGDLCRWILSRSGQIIDDGAWANLASILNGYKFSGYMNDPGVSSFDWLQSNIIPFLPITMRMGPNGLRPVLIELWALSHVDPIYMISVGDNDECQQISGIDTIRATSDLSNEYTLEFAKRGFDQSYTSQVRVTNIEIESYDVPSDYSIVSQNRYGKKPTHGSNDYIYDRETAMLVALKRVRSKALPLFQFTITAPTDLGWLMIGDVVEVNVDRLHLIDHKMIITKKLWAGNHWRFDLLYENNPIQNQ